MGLSSVDVAIRLAHQASALRFVERESRFGDTYIAIEDRVGVITVVETQEAADALVKSALEKRA